MMKRFSDLQLTFDLPDLDEVAGDAEARAISYQEAREISEGARLALERGRSDAAPLPGWMDEYLGLVEKGWPWRVAVYMAWASSPKGTRWPKTLQALATDVLGLAGPRVVHTWREKYPAIDTVVAMLQAAPLWEHRRDVIEALVTSAMEPDYKSFNDRKLFLEMVGDYTPRSQIEVGRKVGDTLEELSDDELRAMVGRKGSLQPTAISYQQDQELNHETHENEGGEG